MPRLVRRLPPAAIALGIGLAALLVGLGALRGVVADERQDALAAVELRRAAAAEYAARELAEELRRRMAAAEPLIDQALASPLRPCPGCFHSQSGTQLLPRVRAGAPPPDRPARTYYRDLVEGGGPVGAGDDATWARRARLHGACRTDPAGAVDAILAHRARYALPVEQELASALALLDACRPPEELVTRLVRTGLEVAGGRRIEGLEPLVLRRLRHLSAGDAEFAVERVLAAARRAGVRSDDFEARLGEVAAAPLPFPAALDGPTLAPGSAGGTAWYLEPISGGLQGLSVDLGPLLTGIARKLRSGVLLGAEDRLAVRGPIGRPTPLRQIQVELSSRGARAAVAAIHRRYLLKLGLLLVCGAMAVAIAALGLALQGRRRRLLEVKSQFVAGVSHELRTPLASMRVLAETLVRRTHDMAQVRDYPVRLLRDIDGMTFLVENILSFNRMTRGRWQPHRETIVLRELVEGVCQEAGERSGRAVNAEVQLGELTRHADPELLRLLFHNLASNAIAYNRRDPIEIRAEGRLEADGSVELLFSDNGVGIPAEEHERVFAEFHRGPESAMARGSGLGLALCRRVMALHGGTIAIRGSGGWGTTFRLWFPRAPS